MCGQLRGWQSRTSPCHLVFDQLDLLGKFLFFEVSNRVVIGVGQEVHDVRRRLDVVLYVSTNLASISNESGVATCSVKYLQMRHQMSPVSFNLLIR